MSLIILTPEQAAKVLGPSKDRAAALEPRETLDGGFVLPARVLGDPCHQPHYTLLAGLPRADVAEVEFPTEEEERDI